MKKLMLIIFNVQQPLCYKINSNSKIQYSKGNQHKTFIDFIKAKFEEINIYYKL